MRSCWTSERSCCWSARCRSLSARSLSALSWPAMFAVSSFMRRRPILRPGLVIGKHEKGNGRVLAGDRGDDEHVEDLVESEDGRIRVGAPKRVDERAGRVEEPAGEDEQRASE